MSQLQASVRSAGALVTVLVASLAAVACSTPSPTPTPTAGPTPLATDAPSGTQSVLSLSPSGAALVPGTYTRTGFSPTIVLDVDGPWYAVQAAQGFFDIQQDRGSPDVIAVQFANVEAAYAAGGRAVILESAAAGQAALEGHPGLIVLGSSAGLVDGHEGVVIEVENATDGNVQVLRVPAGTLEIAPDRRLWIGLFDTTQGVLGILVGGSVAKWDEALAAAEPVLESVRIED